MKDAKKRFGWLATGLACVMLLGAASVPLAQEHAEEEVPMVQIGPQVSMKNYSSLTALVAMVCSDAMGQFDGFFDRAPVLIEPFVVLSAYSAKDKVTVLGATMADQMAAVIGNESLAVWRPDGEGEYEQKVSGLLQEVDGYLRLHITGVNSHGERHSYVVNVEMSEPIYRALHSYIYIP